MSVHFKSLKTVTREDNTARRSREYVSIPRPSSPAASIADLIAVKGGSVLLAQFKEREEAKEQAHEKAAERAAKLMEIAEHVFSGLLGQAWIYEKALNRSRFTALGWGSDETVSKLADEIGKAYRSSASYVKAFEVLTEQPCRFVPPVVYRNAKQIASY
jgi:hypothetical protein